MDVDPGGPRRARHGRDTYGMHHRGGVRLPHEERGDDVYVLAELLNSTQSAVRAHVHVTN